MKLISLLFVSLFATAPIMAIMPTQITQAQIELPAPLLPPPVPSPSQPSLIDLYQRIGIKIKDKDYQSAIKDLDQLIGLEPNSSQAYFLRGFTYLNLGKIRSAIADYDQAIRLDSSNADFYVARGLARIFSRDFGLALADLDQAIRLKPNQAESYMGRGLIHEILSNRKAAVTDFQKAAQLAREQNDLQLYEQSMERLKRLQK
jgi:tetratricopeptide (TPR) repeat protein